MKCIRKHLFLVLVTIISTGLFGCGESTQVSLQHSSSIGVDMLMPEKVVQYESCELTFLCYGDLTEQLDIEKAVGEFEIKYPGITVDMRFVEKNDSYDQSRLCDVNRIDWEQIYLMQDSKARFYNLYEAFQYLSLGEFGQNNLNHCTVDEHLLAVPEFFGISSFMFQESLFKDAGIEVPNSYQELLSAGFIFQSKLGEAYYPLALDDEDRILFLITYLQSAYGKPWLVNGVLQYTEQEIEKGLDLLIQMEEQHVIPRLELVSGEGSIEALWNDGFYAGVFDWDTEWYSYQESVKNRSGVVLEIPFQEFKTHNGQMTKVMESFAISKDTKHPNEAALLIDFFVNQKEGVEKLSGLKEVPLSKYARNIYKEENWMSEEYLSKKEELLTYVPSFVDLEIEKLCYDMPKEYWQVMNGFGYGDYTQKEAAQLLIDQIAD